MKRRSVRVTQRAQRKLAREAGQKRPGGASNYARKRAWCLKHGVWGFEVPNPKPWRSA